MKKKKHEPMSMEDAVLSLEKALLSGHVLHTFRSGGGLQVARIEKVSGKERRGGLKGYGEHPNINDAIRHAGEDFAAGGRPYSEVYGSIDWDDPKGGKEGIYPMYLTGTHDVEGKLDQWCKQNTLDARGRNGKIEVELRGWGEFRTDNAVVAEVKRTRVPVRIELRGYVYECAYDLEWGGVSTRIVSSPEGRPQHRAWMWHTKQIGVGATFADALNAAFAAKVEDTDED